MVVPCSGPPPGGRGVADFERARSPRFRDPTDVPVNSRTLVFVNRAADAGPPDPSADVVVLDPTWTPDPRDRLDLISVRSAFQSVLRDVDLFDGSLARLDAWAAAGTLADRFLVDGITWWYRIRMRVRWDIQELMLWRHVLDVLAPAGRYQAIVFYLVAYGLMNLLAFAALPRGADDSTQDRLDAFKGLYQRKPFAAVMIAIAMLSLAGLPPLPGFIAKFLVFRNVVAAGYTTYAVLGLVASYLGIYFYLRVIQYMFMGATDPAAAHGRPRRFAFVTSVLCLVPAVLLALFPGWLLDRL